MFKRRFLEELHPLVSWGITLFLSGLALMLMGLFIDKQQVAEYFGSIMQKMPSAIKNLFGGDISTSFSFIYLLGMGFDTVAPVLLLVYTSLAVLGLYTREASQGNLEFLFSLPINRLKIITQRILVFLLDLSILQILFVLGTLVGALVTGLKLDYAAILWASVDLFLLNVCISGLAYLLSLWINDYSRGVLLVLGILLGLFIINIGLGDTKNLLLHVNPFHYLDAAQIIRGAAIPWWRMLGFTLSGMALWSAGAYLYTRKQI